MSETTANAQSPIGLVKSTFSEWSEDKAPRLAASLAYYTLFALAPILLIAIAIVGLVIGKDQAQQQIVAQVNGLLGSAAGGAITTMLQQANSRPSSGIIATVVGLITLLFASSGVFGELQDALNTIWEVQPKPGQGILATLKNRFFSFTMVLGIGFLLLTSLVISTAIGAAGKFVAGDQYGATLLWKIVNFVVSFGITTLLFALIYKILPDAKVQWRDVWVGALATALLFTIGKAALGWYLSQPGTTSAYGAAGSFVALLLWVYYSSQILFFGAEFTQVYAKSYGSKIEPAENAVPVTEEARAQQGLPRQGDLEQAGGLREREVGASIDETPAASQPERTATQTAAPAQPPSAGIGAVAGFILGVLIGKRQRPNNDER